LQGLAVLAAIEAQHGYRNDVDVETLELDAGSICNAFEALAHDCGGVLGRKEQHGSRVPDGEAPQAGDACGNCHGEIEGKEGFTALGFAADDADGLSHPQFLDEPGILVSLGHGEECGANGGKPLHLHVVAQKELSLGGLPEERTGLQKCCPWISSISCML
jgi:hypothetical protein